MLNFKEFRKFPSRITTSEFAIKRSPATGAELFFQVFLDKMETVVKRNFEFEHADERTILAVLNPLDDQGFVQEDKNDF